MLITNSKDLSNYCALVENSKYIAVDTEFVRNSTFYPQLSLVQIAAKDIMFILDATADVDVTPLKNILENPDIIKVFHSFSQDLEVLSYKFNIIVNPVFDTQIAASFYGFRQNLGYEKLVDVLLQKKISKTLQFSDWMTRPLQAKQLEYASFDVVYLYEIFEIMQNKLTKKKQFQWVLEECQQLAKENKNCAQKLLPKFVVFSNKTDRLLVYLRIIMWREDTAKSLNKPRQHILNDDEIKKVANITFNTVDNMELLARFFLSIPDAYIKKLHLLLNTEDSITDDEIDIIEQALKVHHRHVQSRRNALYKLLKALLYIVSEKYSINEEVIATTHDILMFANGFSSKITSGWRHHVIGKEAIRLRNGEIGVSIRDGSGMIVDVRPCD